VHVPPGLALRIELGEHGLVQVGHERQRAGAEVQLVAVDAGEQQLEVALRARLLGSLAATWAG
jgi:hypothetical protein